MLKFTALSGTISVTENLYLYETEKDMVIVDCGVGFPDMEMRGVDLVVPDFSYVIQNKNKLRGVVVSQGHEDHIGALPFLLKELDTEIWAAEFVSLLLADKFDEYGTTNGKVNVFDPVKGSFNVGEFVFYPFRVTHSIPDTCGFAIDTPEGRVFHVPEHKMDQDPVDGMPTDIPRIQGLANNKNVLFLASDCLGSNKPGYTKGEKHIETNLQKIVDNAKNTVYFTAISSNIGRFQQAINTAIKSGRKVCYVGRSVEKKCELANSLNYLKYPPDLVVDIKKSKKIPRNKLMYIVSGCYGQEGSSLYRLSLDDHKRLSINEGDTLIFSADPAPPYSKESEDFVIDNFIEFGVDVHYYDLDEELYVSGHGSQKDIIEMFDLTRPKYFIPIGGAIRFMHSYKNLAVTFGAGRDQIFELKPGDNVSFSGQKATRGKRINVKQVLVEGMRVGEVGNVILGDRRALSQAGIVVAIIRKNKGRVVGDAKIVSRGFVFGDTRGKLISDAETGLRPIITSNKSIKDLKDSITDYLQNYFNKNTGINPMVLPVVIEE